MSDNDDNIPPRQEGRRKDGKPYAPGNTRDDGGYEVGRNRPPEAGQFRAGDGRKRGRRPRGTANADTEFERELNRKVVIRENGKERKVTKGHSIDLRLIDNASNKGQNKAIEMVHERRERIRARKEEDARRYHTLPDENILHQYLRERSTELNVAPGLFGDPADGVVPMEEDNA